MTTSSSSFITISITTSNLKVLLEQLWTQNKENSVEKLGKKFKVLKLREHDEDDKERLVMPLSWEWTRGLWLGMEWELELELELELGLGFGAIGGGDRGGEGGDG